MASGRPRLRIGCFGALVLGLGLILGLYALLAPWSYHIGGRWTPVFWWGCGRLRTASGAEYPLFLYFYPSLGYGSRLAYKGRRPSSGLQGMAWLCTSPGVTQRLSLRGTIYGAYLHTEGSLIHFRLLQPRPFIDTGRRRDYFDLYGEWHGQDLVMEDHGSWERSFQRGSRNEQAAVTLSWGSYRDFKRQCGVR